MDYQTIRLETEGPLARLTLASSGGNRIGTRLLRELQDACDGIANNDSVRVLILSAEGPDFCSGWSPDAFAEPEASLFDAFGCVARLPQPVVCAIQGAAAGAGLELALTADIRLCSRDARFRIQDERSPLPLAGGGQRLARLAGRGVALSMLLAGEELGPEAAYRAGIVAKVVDDGTLEGTAEAIALSIAEKGPIATRYAKEAVHRGLEMTLEQALRYETDLTIILQTTADRAEGVRAFVDKRRPEFKGK